MKDPRTIGGSYANRQTTSIWDCPPGEFCQVTKQASGPVFRTLFLSLLGSVILIGKDPDAGTDCRQEEKGMTEDERVGWHHPLDGHEFEQAPGVGDGQGGLACCSPWGCRVGHD